MLFIYNITYSFFAILCNCCFEGFIPRKRFFWGIVGFSSRFIFFKDFKIAYTVGKRYSKYKEPIILEIDSAKMYTDGFKFYKSENGVWLTDNVPSKYIKYD